MWKRPTKTKTHTCYLCSKWKHGHAALLTAVAPETQLHWSKTVYFHVYYFLSPLHFKFSLRASLGKAGPLPLQSVILSAGRTRTLWGGSNQRPSGKQLSTPRHFPRLKDWIAAGLMGIGMNNLGLALNWKEMVTHGRGKKKKSWNAKWFGECCLVFRRCPPGSWTYTWLYICTV